MENTATRAREAAKTTPVRPTRTDWVLFAMFVIAAIIFATSVMTQLGTLMGLAACLLAGFGVMNLIPTRAIGR